MSCVFEGHLNEIVSQLYCPGDHDDFYKVRDLVKNVVMENRLLRSICDVEFLNFGSATHGIRMYNNDEYDVMIELKFPNYEQIIVRPDRHRPGMVHLCFEQLDSNTFVEDTLLDNRWYLKRQEIHNWIQCILIDVHNRSVRGSNGSIYTLHYQRRQNCHTITAVSQTREFSIDFVPAIKVWFEGVDCQVVPKAAPGPKRSHGCTFIVNVIREELDMFALGGNVIQDAVILLKALCESKGLPKIRFYHLVSVALWYMDREDIYEYSFDYIFLELLDELCQALEDNDLPYYFYEPLNLLSTFKPHQLAEYSQVLNEAYRILSTYPLQEKLSYERCSWHFFEED